MPSYPHPIIAREGLPFGAIFLVVAIDVTAKAFATGPGIALS